MHYTNIKIAANCLSDFMIHEIKAYISDSENPCLFTFAEIYYITKLFNINTVRFIIYLNQMFYKCTYCNKTILKLSS